MYLKIMALPLKGLTRITILVVMDLISFSFITNLVIPSHAVTSGSTSNHPILHDILV